jgi:hypothetical protein
MVYNHYSIGPKNVVGKSDYMPKKRNKAVHKCCCNECIEQPNGETALLHTSINRLVAAFDEKHRRQFAGLLASQLGHGGIQYISKITGLNRETISRGKRDIGANVALDGRIRAPGGGRHKVEKKRQTC